MTNADQAVHETNYTNNSYTKTITVGASAGSLLINLTPSGVGAWNVDGGVWQSSGATVSNLSAGSHQVSYQSVTGYTGPANENVTITAGQTLTLSRSYSAVSSNIDLAPYQPPGWSDKIVVSTTNGSTTDSTTILPTDTLYIDWAIVNSGTGDITAAFVTKLYVDGVENHSWSLSSLKAGYYATIMSYSLGSLGAGSHQLEIVADPGHTVAGADETNNSYTKTITVGFFDRVSPD